MCPVAYQPPSDLYAILGVPPDASDEEIGRAFRRLARQHHPDLPGGEEERFRDLKDAYDTLGDPRRRARYDAARARPGAGTQIPVTRRPPPRRPPPAHAGEVELTLGFEEAVLGATVRLEVPAARECGACGATGLSEPAACASCGGEGRTVQLAGQFAIKRVCDDCGGTGVLAPAGCPGCGGAGWLASSRVVSVRVPPGIGDGARLRVAPGGEGAGEVYARVTVSPHKWFSRRGGDLHLRVPVSLAEAVLGARFQVPTIEGGRAWLEVPPATADGTELRIGGRGVPGSPPGDLVATIRVVPPGEISEELRQALAAACPPPAREWEHPSQG